MKLNHCHEWVGASELHVNSRLFSYDVQCIIGLNLTIIFLTLKILKPRHFCRSIVTYNIRSFHSLHDFHLTLIELDHSTIENLTRKIR